MDQDAACMVAASKEVIENGNSLPKTQTMKGVETVMPITSAKDKEKRRLEVKARSSLMMGIPNEHQLNLNSIKDAKLLLEAIEKGVNAAFGVTTAGTQVNATNSTNTDNLSDVVICACSASQSNSSQLVNEDLEQIHLDDLEEMELKWQMAIMTMRARRFLKNT
nr:ribonuclease H-like domain-containing protein [Tanacetum cinerariifolium]